MKRTLYCLVLDPIGVPGIWFPFGIGVSRSQYIYAIVIPLLALLIVRTNVPRVVSSARGIGRSLHSQGSDA